MGMTSTPSPSKMRKALYGHDRHHHLFVSAERARVEMAMAAITHSFSQRNQDGV